MSPPTAPPQGQTGALSVPAGGPDRVGETMAILGCGKTLIAAFAHF